MVASGCREDASFASGVVGSCHHGGRGDLQRYDGRLLVTALGVCINGFENFGEKSIAVVLSVDEATYLRSG